MAGVVAGYLSHIPHNVSTLKLLEVLNAVVVVNNDFFLRTQYACFGQLLLSRCFRQLSDF